MCVWRDEWGILVLFHYFFSGLVVNFFLFVYFIKKEKEGVELDGWGGWEDLGEVGEGNRDLNLLCKVSMKNNFIEQLKSVLQYFQKVPAHGQKGCSLSTAKVLWLEGWFPTVHSINISNMKK